MLANDSIEAQIKPNGEVIWL
ncbi:hypothetical protein [Fischerella thermalis]